MPHMGQTATAPTPFAQWLRSQLDERGWGVRTLARKIDPLDPEVPRRALNRYLAGSLPTEPNRAGIARGLGIRVEDVPGAAQEVAPLGDTFRGDLVDDDRGSADGGRAHEDADAAA